MLITWFMASQMALSPVEADRWEPAGIPALTYRSDLGLGLGVLGATTRFRSDCQPFCWRALVLLQGVFRLDPENIVPSKCDCVCGCARWTRPVATDGGGADYDEQEVGYSGIPPEGAWGPRQWNLPMASALHLGCASVYGATRWRNRLYRCVRGPGLVGTTSLRRIKLGTDAVGSELR